MKYRQRIIPSVTTPKEWKDLSSDALRKAVREYYRQHLQGRSVVNEHLNLRVLFTAAGRDKTAKGGHTYRNKAVSVLALDSIMEKAEFSNFGQRKPNDPPELLYYANFKAKVMIDGQLKHIRLATRLFEKAGCMYYSLEVNLY